MDKELIQNHKKEKIFMRFYKDFNLRKDEEYKENLLNQIKL